MVERWNVHTVRYEATIIRPFAKAVNIGDLVTSRGGHNLASASISQRIAENEESPRPLYGQSA